MKFCNLDPSKEKEKTKFEDLYNNIIMEIEQNVKKQINFHDLPNNMNKAKSTIQQLVEEYNIGLDSTNLISSIKILKLKVEYLLSQDINYQQSQNEPRNNYNMAGNKQTMGIINLKPNLNLISKMEPSQFMPPPQLPNQHQISPLKAKNTPNTRMTRKSKERKSMMKKIEDRRLLYSNSYDYL